MKVYVGIGHGRRPDGTYDPGAVNGPVQEHAEATRICEIVDAALGRCNVQRFVEHDSGASHDPDFIGSTKAVNDGKFDLAIEVHLDTAKAPPGGFGIYVSDAGQHFASAISDGYRERGLPLRLSYHDVRGLYFLKGTHCPALIWESDHVTHHDDAWVNSAGEAIAEGICVQMGTKYIAPGGGHVTPPDVPAGVTNVVDEYESAQGWKWALGADGGVFTEDGAPFFGSMGGKPLNAPMVSIVSHDDSGYWLIGADGGIFAFGSAPPKTPYSQLVQEYHLGVRRIAKAYRAHNGGLRMVSNRGEHYEF